MKLASGQKMRDYFSLCSESFSRLLPGHWTSSNGEQLVLLGGFVDWIWRHLLSIRVQKRVRTLFQWPESSGLKSKPSVGCQLISDISCTRRRKRGGQGLCEQGAAVAQVVDCSSDAKVEFWAKERARGCVFTVKRCLMRNEYKWFERLELNSFMGRISLTFKGCVIFSALSMHLGFFFFF